MALSPSVSAPHGPMTKLISLISIRSEYAHCCVPSRTTEIGEFFHVTIINERKGTNNAPRHYLLDVLHVAANQNSVLNIL
jgi:hypothetical protein